jgi:ketosteroid isomerase-like protein
MNHNELIDQFEIRNALIRFANGMDTDDLELIGSAFSDDAVADFGPAAVKVGIQFPVLEGRSNIQQGLGGFAAGLDTSHSVSNEAVKIEGDVATMYALVEAQHLPKGVRNRSMLMKNRYDVQLVRGANSWLIKRMTIDNIWAEGDVTVITGG